MKEIVKKLGELEIGENIFRDGHIYTVTRVDFHEDDDNLVTVKLGYPRKINSGFEPIDHITSHTSRPIITYYH